MYNIAAYLRISRDDHSPYGSWDYETASITNQRDMIRDFVTRQQAYNGLFADLKVNLIDYVDDGFSGTSSNRQAYQKMLADASKGFIDCIICKDLSRIGRNMLDVDDLLMNRLLVLNVRLIAINNDYDSFLNPLTNLELGLINLTNQYYSRDLALKSAAAKVMKSKKGEYLNFAPFGYKKCSEVKNKLVPDKTKSKYVQTIFNLAALGKNAAETAKTLNEQNIPTPSGRGFWTNSKVCKILKNEVYLGKTIYKGFVTEDTHEPLVSQLDFEKANFGRAKPASRKKKHYNQLENIFGGKVRCPHCGYAMLRHTKSSPKFRCPAVRLTNKYGCKDYAILQKDIENAVNTVIGEGLKLIDLAQTAKNLKTETAAEEKAIKKLEASLVRLFKDLILGKISRQDFLNKKGMINDAIEEKRIARPAEKLAERPKDVSLNKGTISLFIEKILIYNEKEIQIVWRFVAP
jgi:DNA invertase Pin-like site-specific DNA recombinase